MSWHESQTVTHGWVLHALPPPLCCTHTKATLPATWAWCSSIYIARRIINWIRNVNPVLSLPSLRYYPWLFCSFTTSTHNHTWSLRMLQLRRMGHIFTTRLRHVLKRDAHRFKSHPCTTEPYLFVRYYLLYIKFPHSFLSGSLVLSVCGHSLAQTLVHFGAIKSFEVKHLWFEYLHKMAARFFRLHTEMSPLTVPLRLHRVSDSSLTDFNELNLGMLKCQVE